MRVITVNKITKYILQDTDTVTQKDDRVEVRGSRNFDIGDFKKGVYSIHNNVTDVPGDWTGNKYNYDGVWTLNPNYVEPEIDEEI
jgi:hypothetical protein